MLTPTGWRPFGNLQVGDEVIGANGKPTRILGVFPQGVRPVFRVRFSDGAETRCCADHLWTVRSRRNHRTNAVVEETISLKALIERGLTRPRKDKRRDRKFAVPIVAPVEFAQHAEGPPIDPYLLGMLIGDGSTRSGGIRFSSADAEMIEAVVGTVPVGVFVDNIPGSRCDWRLTTRARTSRNPLTQALVALGLWGKGSADKFIPERYLLGTVAERLALLQGLLDTDGFVDRNTNNVEFTTVSRRLSRDVQFLIRSLGGLATPRLKPTTGQTAYRMSVRLPSGVPLFRLRRKAARYRPHTRYEPGRFIDSAEWIGATFVQCIAVDAPDGLYVTDDMIVTHNTTMGVNELARFALEHPGAATAWIAPTYQQAKIAFRWLCAEFAGAFVGAPNQSELRIVWRGGATTKFFSVEKPEAIRGFAFDFFVGDEFATWSREAWEPIVRPTLRGKVLLQRGGGRCLLVGTPKGRNLFWELWQRGQDRERWPEYESWQLPSTANPFLPVSDIREARESLPLDVYQQEYEAAFLEDASGVFRNLAACEHGELRGYEYGHQYVIGWDPAKHADASVITVIDTTMGSVVAIERILRVDYTIQMARVAALAKEYHAFVLMDSTGVGDPILEQLQQMQVPCDGYEFTNKSKVQLIQHLAVTIERGEVSWPKAETVEDMQASRNLLVMRRELEMFEYEITAAGSLRYSAPDGKHDDCVMSLALAVWAAKYYGMGAPLSAGLSEEPYTPTNWAEAP